VALAENSRGDRPRMANALSHIIVKTKLAEPYKPYAVRCSGARLPFKAIQIIRSALNRWSANLALVAFRVIRMDLPAPVLQPD
jgi:hypothetical protein